jgi:hypothetical protein
MMQNTTVGPDGNVSTSSLFVCPFLTNILTFSPALLFASFTMGLKVTGERISKPSSTSVSQAA